MALANSVRQVNLKHAAKLLLIAFLYIAAAKLGLALADGVRQVTSVWPPTGIALVTLLIFGFRYWPGILIGAFVANVFTSEPWGVAIAICIGNTLEALVGAFLLKRVAKVTPQNLISTARNILALVFFAAIVSTTVSATIGVYSLAAGGIIPWSHYGVVWLTWWTGDMMGDLIFATALLGLLNSTHIAELRRKLPEASLSMIVTLVLAIFIFRFTGNTGLSISYLIFPALIWAAFRYRQAGVATSLLVVTIVAVWGTVTGRGPFITYQSQSENLVLLQAFLFVASVTSLLVAAMVTERLRAVKALVDTEELSRAKDEFIDLASHELRTPATQVKQYVGLIQEGYIKGRLTPHQRWALEQAYASNESLLKIINDLLGVARMDAGKVVINDVPTNFSGLVREVIRRQTPSFKERKQTITSKMPRKPVRLVIDPDLIKIVVVNLLDNASKYSPEGKKVHVTLSSAYGVTTLSIADEGVGINPKQIPKLFDKFTRFENALSVKVGGSGIGLYWAKKIIDFHGGTISVDSKENEGTTFTVNFFQNGA